MSDYNERAQKILERVNELASISDEPDYIRRTFGSRAFIEGSIKVLSWMKAASLETRIDNIGNVRGRLQCKHKAAKTFVIGSHIDTVINAGKFDGPLGVIMGLDLMEQLARNNIELPFHIELIAFSDEEGVRFHTAYLGSKVVAGSFTNDLLNKTDKSGINILQVIREMGGDPGKLINDAILHAHWLGYFEIHIEQGPVLYEKNIPAAIVSAIAGQVRVEMTFTGVAGHAGTVPMNMRKDALCCAAEFILETERFAKSGRDKIVATIGTLNISNQATNVIPGEVVCSLDLRSDDERILVSSHEQLYQACREMCRHRNILFKWNLVQQTKPVECDKEMNRFLELSIREAGYECVSLVSGAGHDAVPISEAAPVAMLFVRCFEGISHNPLENVESKDIEAAIRISERFIHHLAKYQK